MKIFIILLLLPQTALSFFGSELSAKTQLELERMIVKGEEQNFIKLWGNKVKGQHLGKIEKQLGHRYLGLLTSTDNWTYSAKTKSKGTRVCFPSALKHLLKLGAIPSENTDIYTGIGNIQTGHITGSLNNLCTKSVQALISKADATTIKAATVSWRMSKFVEIANNAQKATLLVSSIMALQTTNAKLCKDKKLNCEAIQHVKDEFSWFKKYEKQKVFNATKKGKKQLKKEKACYHYYEYLSYLDKIKEEKERGKLSGYVNVKSLKDWGDRAYAANKRYKQYATECKK